MKIVHLLPASAKFPLSRHNGRYEWALRLARIQAKNGHDVTIFAGKGSYDDSPITWKSINDSDTEKLIRNEKLIELAMSDPSFDIFHSHFDSLGFSLAHKTAKPVVTTQHWFPSESIAKKIAESQSPNAIAVPVTKRMKAEDERLNIPSTEVIYHGIDLDLFKPDPSATKSTRLLFVGRISKHKGLLETVKLIHNLGLELDIVGKINNVDKPYWEKVLKYVDGEKIRYLGTKTQPELVQLFSAASAFIFLPSHIEAFGQTIIESQACGIPAITNNSGANSELVSHGKTGFVIHNSLELYDAIKSLENIRPEDCVSWAHNFSIETMVKKYDELYDRLVNSPNMN